jgi:hypothetical protein
MKSPQMNALPKTAKRRIGCFLTRILSLGSIFLNATSLGHGFNANWVQISRQPDGKYRVEIKYTHVEAGEFREAHVDFSKKADAVDLYQKLAQGADFFLGDIKNNVHFHKPAEQNSPF